MNSKTLSLSVRNVPPIMVLVCLCKMIGYACRRSWFMSSLHSSDLPRGGGGGGSEGEEEKIDIACYSILLQVNQ